MSVLVETKNWWESRSVWGGVMAVVAGVAGWMGYNVPVELQGLLTDSLLSVVATVGGILAVYGRVKATASVE